MNPTYLVIHHSLTSDGNTVNMQAIRDYHVNTLKWRAEGYHYFVELIDGRYEILKGRMDNEDGAHCLGFNDKSLGICMIGNFDIDPPPPVQRNMLLKLVRSLMEIYGIKQDGVIGHRETYELRGKPAIKTCPGIMFRMGELRKEI